MRMIAAVMLACSQAMAAEIKEDRSLARPPFDSVVTATGEIVKGDSDKFDAVVAAAAHHPLVELNSPGGDLMEGFAIGETIRLHHLATYVIPNSVVSQFDSGGAGKIVMRLRSGCSLRRLSPVPRFRL
jgi:hypothetical protein